MMAIIMSENKDQSQEEKSASVLKEVHEKADNPKSGSPEDGQPTNEEAAEQQKGSDADVDRNVGFDDQPDGETAKEQEKGTG